MANRQRKPNESFKAYRRNLRLEEKRIKQYLQGRVVNGPSENRSIFSNPFRSTAAQAVGANMRQMASLRSGFMPRNRRTGRGR